MIEGTDIKTEKDLNLKADKDIIVQSSKDEYNYSSKSSSKGNISGGVETLNNKNTNSIIQQIKNKIFNKKKGE